MAQEQRRYLSTDPNAGEPVAPPRQYLSTDPNAGEPTAPTNQVPYFLRQPTMAELMANSPGSMTHTLPTVGGAIGSMVGGAPGAAVGAAAGTGFRELIDNAGELVPAILDVGRNLMDPDARQATLSGFGEGAASGAVEAGTNAAVHGALDAAGGLAMRGARAAMRTALRPGMRVVNPATGRSVIGGKGTTIAERFRNVDIPQRMLDRGVPVRNAGLTQVDDAARAAAQRVDEAIRSATQRGATVDQQTLVGPLQDLYNNFSGTPAERAKMAKIIGEFVDSLPNRLPPGAAQGMKQWQREAAERFMNTGRGAMRARVAEPAGRGLQQGIEEAVDAVAPTGQPPLRALNAETQEAMALREALWAALNREAGSGRFNLGGLLDSPRGWGAVGHGLNTAGLYGPNATRAALLALMAGDQADR